MPENGIVSTKGTIPPLAAELCLTLVDCLLGPLTNTEQSLGVLQTEGLLLVYETGEIIACIVSGGDNGRDSKIPAEETQNSRNNFRIKSSYFLKKYEIG